MNVKWSRPERQPTHFHSTIYSPSISTALSLLMPPLLSIPGFKTTSVKVLIHVKLKPYQQHTQCANSNVASPINTSNADTHDAQIQLPYHLPTQPICTHNHNAQMQMPYHLSTQQIHMSTANIAQFQNPR